MEDALTIKRIDLMHPKVRSEALKLYKAANDKLGDYCMLRFSYTFRTPEEQRELFLKRPKVTNADSWQSIHNYGLAFDIVIMYDNNKDGKYEEASWNMKVDKDKDGISDWLEVTKVFVDAGWSNGFISNGKRWDFPHFQKDFGLSWRQMKSKIDKGLFIEEIIEGRKYRYINL